MKTPRYVSEEGADDLFEVKGLSETSYISLFSGIYLIWMSPVSTNTAGPSWTRVHLGCIVNCCHPERTLCFPWNNRARPLNPFSAARPSAQRTHSSGSPTCNLLAVQRTRWLRFPHILCVISQRPTEISLCILYITSFHYSATDCNYALR